MNPWTVKEWGERSDKFVVVRNDEFGGVEIWTDGRTVGLPHWAYRENAELKAAELNGFTIDLTRALLP